jgi:hypothetical protein
MDDREEIAHLENKLRFESVAGKASVYVEQDLRAQAPVHNMVQDAASGAEARAGRKRRKKRSWYKTRINENIAVGLYKKRFIRLKEDMMKNIAPIRTLPGNHRKWKCFNKYKCNLQPSS